MVSFTVQTSQHAQYGWVLLPVEIGGIIILQMVLNTGLPFSGITPQAGQQLVMAELVPPIVARAYLLRGLRIAQHPVPEVSAHVRHRLAQTGVDGFLGLDFLSQFTDVHFNVPSLRLTLTLASDL
jgi:hypothetical protein